MSNLKTEREVAGGYDGRLNNSEPQAHYILPRLLLAICSDMLHSGSIFATRRSVRSLLNSDYWNSEV